MSTTRRAWMAVALAGCGQRKEAAFSVEESQEAIGGQKAVRLRRAMGETASAPILVEAVILPGRGFNTWQLQGLVPGAGVQELFAAPTLAEASRLMSGGENDFQGNESFKNGGAILVPFANRIRGKYDAKARTITTQLGDKSATLPANWVGKNAGAEPHAMHGLILDAAGTVTAKEADADGARVEATYQQAFQGEWPGSMNLACSAELTAAAFVLRAVAKNTGSEPMPMGIGWHPYLRIPSGDRRQAKLKIPANSRALVDNYDNVFPTGAVESVAGSKFDFREARALGDQFLDDCFFDLIRNADGSVAAEIHDPAAHYALRITSRSPQVKAYQCYAPPDKPFIVLEPQFNIGGPFDKIWRDRDTGMVTLAPGEEASYDASVEAYRI